MEDAFRREHIGNDLGGVHAPRATIQTIYNGHTLVAGQHLTPTQVKDQPLVRWANDPNALYCLVMHDIDAPIRSKPKFKEWQHWCVVNIPGDHVDRGHVLAEYVGAGPPNGTGLHRYVFLVYKQPNRINVEDEPVLKKNSIQGRRLHKIKDFAKKYRMDGPIAANFFQAKWDPYVSELVQQFVEYKS